MAMISGCCGASPMKNREDKCSCCKEYTTSHDDADGMVEDDINYDEDDLDYDEDYEDED